MIARAFPYDRPCRFQKFEATETIVTTGTTIWKPGLSERLTSRVKLRCKRASKDFENLNIFCCFSAMDTRWNLKLGQGEVNLSV